MGRVAAATAALLGAYYAVGVRAFPTDTEVQRREGREIAQRLRQQAGPRDAVLPSYQYTAPIRFWFVQYGLRRSQVIEHSPLTGRWPDMEEWDSVTVVQPVEGSGIARYRLDLSLPRFDEFQQREAIEAEGFEVTRLTR